MAKLKINYGGAITDCETIKLCSEKYDEIKKMLTISVRVDIGEVKFKIFCDSEGKSEVKLLIKKLIEEDSSVEVIIQKSNNQIIFTSGDIYSGNIDFDIYEPVGETTTVTYK